mgnify:CR=1 FL=1
MSIYQEINCLLPFTDIFRTLAAYPYAFSRLILTATYTHAQSDIQALPLKQHLRPICGKILLQGFLFKEGI